MARHFMSRDGVVAYLVASRERLGRKHEEAVTEAEKNAVRGELDTLRQLILDVRAGRVDMLTAQGMEIVVKI